MRHGSLCTGYGGLDLAAQAVLDGEMVWLSEIDKHAAALCDLRFPSIPNLGDLKVIDWSTVEPIDVLTAGYPCQPFSSAGKRAGADDPRHLWPFIRDAVGALRPQLVVLENVRGHLTLGFEQVLADLHALGFDAEWSLVRASDVGACHQRARIFIVAWDAQCSRKDALTTEGASRGAASESGCVAADTRRTEPWRNDRAVPRPPAEGGRSGAEFRAAVDAVQHADGEGPQGTEPQPPQGLDGPAWPGEAPADADRGRLGIDEELDSDPTQDAPDGDPRWGHADGLADEGRWGSYADAIRRHEHALGRCAPAPADARGRLSPHFVEWMMMLPEGWVCDLDVSRSQHLKMLGNGVVPPQAAYAIDGLLARV